MAGNTDLKAPDLKAHVQTYDRMIGLLKWGAVACAIIVGLVIWLIA